MVNTISPISLRESAKQLRKLADAFEEAASGLEQIGGLSLGINAAPERRSSSNIAQASSKDLCYSVLREAGQPMTRAQMMERLREANRTVTEGTLQSYLSRDKRLMSLGRGVWSLRPAQPAGTVPLNLKNGG